MKNKFIDFYLKIAENVSELSHARRMKVGAVIVKNDNILSFGYNGTLPNTSNDCEYEELVVDKTLNDTLIKYIYSEEPVTKKRPLDSMKFTNGKSDVFWFNDRTFIFSIPNDFDVNVINFKNFGEKYVFIPEIPEILTAQMVFYELKTLPTVIHAEQNAIFKLTKSNESSEGATMFITHAPCKHCTNSIIMTGIKTIYFSQYYNNNGIDSLWAAGLEVIYHPKHATQALMMMYSNLKKL